MTEQSPPPQRGRIVWHDLMTTDPAKAKEFYGQLFGWEIKPIDMGPGGNYDMIHVGESGQGGMMPLDTSQGIPSHWVAYANVDDVDEAVKKSDATGGRPLMPPPDIPGVGRVAVIADPTGACICPFKHQGDEAMPEASWPMPEGSFCWEELLTTDVETAKEFYKPIFGWETQEQDMGPMGIYTTLHRGPVGLGGMMKMPAEAEAPPHWLPYMATDDVDACAKRVAELGGQVYKEPGDIPGVGRFAVFADPTGAPFAVYKSE